MSKIKFCDYCGYQYKCAFEYPCYKGADVNEKVRENCDSCKLRDDCVPQNLGCSSFNCYVPDKTVSPFHMNQKPTWCEYAHNPKYRVCRDCKFIGVCPVTAEAPPAKKRFSSGTGMPHYPGAAAWKEIPNKRCPDSCPYLRMCTHAGKDCGMWNKEPVSENRFVDGSCSFHGSPGYVDCMNCAHNETCARLRPKGCGRKGLGIKVNTVSCKSCTLRTSCKAWYILCTGDTTINKCAGCPYAAEICQHNGNCLKDKLDGQNNCPYYSRPQYKACKQCDAFRNCKDLRPEECPHPNGTPFYTTCNDCEHACYCPVWRLSRGYHMDFEEEVMEHLKGTCKACDKGGRCHPLRHNDCDMKEVEASVEKCKNCKRKKKCKSWKWFVTARENTEDKPMERYAYGPPNKECASDKVGPGCNHCMYGNDCLAIRNVACAHCATVTQEICSTCDHKFNCNSRRWILGQDIEELEGEDMNEKSERIINMGGPGPTNADLAAGNITAMVPLTEEDPLLPHIQLLAKRKEVVEREMIALAKEMYTVAMYVKDPIFTVANCRFSVVMQASEGICVTFNLTPADEIKSILKKEAAVQKSAAKGRVKQSIFRQVVDAVREISNGSTVSSVTKQMDWRDLVPEEEKKAGASTLKRHRSRSRTADFEVNKAWQLADKHFPPDFHKLIPTARILVQAQLELLMDETTSDLLFIEGTEEVTGDMV